MELCTSAGKMVAVEFAIRPILPVQGGCSRLHRHLLRHSGKAYQSGQKRT